MKTSLDRALGSEPLRTLEATTVAPKFSPIPTRADVRDVLSLDQSGAVHPDTATVARMLDAPSVLDEKARAMLTMVAAGAVLPGCDGSTLLCVLCSSAAFVALAGAAAWGGYKNFFATKDLGAGEWGVFVRTGVLGTIAGKMGIGADVEFNKARPRTYFKFARKYEAGFQDTVINYPVPAEQSNDALANGQSDYSRALEATDAVKHTFTWSVQARIIPGQEEKFYLNFKKKFGYGDQNTKIFDATQKALSDVVARITFDNVHDANKKRAQFNAEVQASPVLTEFSNTFGLQLTVLLGDIAAPESVSKKAELSATKKLDIEIAKSDIEIKKAQGEGERALQEGRGAAQKAAGLVQTEIYEARKKALGLDEKQAVTMMGLDALSTTATRLADVLTNRVAGPQPAPLPPADGAAPSKK